jgi:hypothetical protein
MSDVSYVKPGSCEHKGSKADTRHTAIRFADDQGIALAAILGPEELASFGIHFELRAE